VALNPTARNEDLEIRRFKYKIEAGCDFAITQPIYNIESYKRFMDATGGAKLPVIMGIWPLISLRNAEFLKYEVPGVDVPDWVIEEMKKAGDSKEEALKRGMDIAVRTMDEARDLVAGFQVSAPFNRAEVALQVIKSVF
jgi:homocysteine S-methyltransferase